MSVFESEMVRELRVEGRRRCCTGPWRSLASREKSGERQSEWSDLFVEECEVLWL